jgi:hypothetical protein
MLKEFWFPLLLAIGGIAAGGWMAAGAEGNARRLWLTLMGVTVLLAWISYIWGDPVRGPIYGATHPYAEKSFRFHVGTNVQTYPIRDLSRGINFNLVPNAPLKLKISQTWWAGRKYDLSVKGADERFIQIMKDNKIDIVGEVPAYAGWDVNYDDAAVELTEPLEINGTKAPRPLIQVVWDGDYDLYVNMVFRVSARQVVIVNSEGIQFRTNYDVTENDFPTRLFKYPSYANRGVRD